MQLNWLNQLSSWMKHNSLVKLFQKSIVQEWINRKAQDESYIEQQVAFLREEIDAMETSRESNPYNLEALSIFQDQERNYRDVQTLEEVIAAHQHAYTLIAENLQCYQQNVPPALIDTYFSLRQTFEEQVEFFFQQIEN